MKMTIRLIIHPPLKTRLRNFIPLNQDDGSFLKVHNCEEEGVSYGMKVTD